jgi:hypothetical protein
MLQGESAMRLVRALLLSAFLLLPEAAAWSEPATPTIPEFSQVKSWQITYTYVPLGYGVPPSATVVVSFLAPDRVKVADRGPMALTAVASDRGTRLFRPELHAAMWVPVEYPLSLTYLGIAMGGKQGPIITDWEAARAGLGSPGGRHGDTTYELLPEEEVAGRRCLVLRTTAPSTMPETPPDWVTTWWFDAEYGLPLAMHAGNGKRQLDIRAKSVAIDPALEVGLFTLKLPPGTPTFRGPFDCCDLNGIAVTRSGEDPDDGASEESPQHTAVTSVLQPASVPAGFRRVNHPVPTWQEGPEGDDWCYTQRWFSESGGVITFDQGVGEWEERHFAVSGDKQPITVRTKAGEMLAYHVPFEGLVLTWEDGKRWSRLEATGVTADDLTKMVKGMREVKPSAPHEDQEEGGD